MSLRIVLLDYTIMLITVQSQCRNIDVIFINGKNIYVIVAHGFVRVNAYASLIW